MRQVLRAASPHLSRLAQCEQQVHPCFTLRRALCQSCQQRRQPWRAERTSRGFASSATQHDKPAEASVKDDSTRPVESALEEPVVIGGGEEDAEAQARADQRAYAKAEKASKRREFAQRVEDAPRHPDYVPAANWKGMPRVGGEFDFQQKPKKVFSGFIPQKKINDSQELLHAINRATVEVYAAHSRSWPLKRLPATGPRQLFESAAPYVKLRPSEDGQSAILEYEAEDIKEHIMREINPDPAKAGNEDELSTGGSEEAITGDSGAAEAPAPVTPPGSAAEDEAAARSEETENVLGEEEAAPNQYEKDKQFILSRRHFDEQWHAVPVTNPVIKFAIARRITQMTGHVLPDPVLHRARTIGEFASYFHNLVTKPTNTFQAMVGHDTSQSLTRRFKGSRGNALRNLSGLEGADKNELANLPNVVISDRKVSMVDREKSKGRWKVIRKALRTRHP